MNRRYLYENQPVPVPSLLAHVKPIEWSREKDETPESEYVAGIDFSNRGLSPVAIVIGDRTTSTIVASYQYNKPPYVDDESTWLSSILKQWNVTHWRWNREKMHLREMHLPVLLDYLVNVRISAYHTVQMPAEKTIEIRWDERAMMLQNFILKHYNGEYTPYPRGHSSETQEKWMKDFVAVVHWLEDGAIKGTYTPFMDYMNRCSFEPISSHVGFRIHYPENYAAMVMAGVICCHEMKQSRYSLPVTVDLR